MLRCGHDVRDIIGRGMRWHDTDAGPVVMMRLDDHPHVHRARQAITRIESGTITDVSLGFHSTRRRPPANSEEIAFPGAETAVERAVFSEVSLVYEGAVPDTTNHIDVVLPIVTA
jgi:phage head maturation protease